MTTPVEVPSDREPAPLFTSADRAAVYAAQSAINGLGQAVEQAIKAQGLLSARFWLIACDEETIEIHTISGMVGPDRREVRGKVTVMAPRCSHVSIDLSFTYYAETKRTAYDAHCRTAEGHHWTMFEPTSVATNRVVQWLMVRGIREGIEKTGIAMTLAGSSDAPVPEVRVEDLTKILSADLGRSTAPTGSPSGNGCGRTW